MIKGCATSDCCLHTRKVSIWAQS